MQEKKYSPYEKCPIYETNHFTFRMVEETDAKDLLQCYSDKESEIIFNSDNCTSNFVFETLEEMKSCIRFWIEEYKKEYYVRFSIVDKRENSVVGTIEIFAKPDKFDVGKVGVLRLDLASRYETIKNLQEIMEMIHKNFSKTFEIDCIITKAVPEATTRIKVLDSNGYKELKDKTITSFDFYYIKAM